MEFEFTNKVSVQVTAKRSIWRRFVFGCGIVSMLITMFQIYMDGFKNVEFLSGIFLPAFLLWQGLPKSTKQDYIAVKTKVSILDSGIEFPEIWRMIDGEIVAEAYKFKTEDIKEYQYSSSSSAVRIMGTPMVTIKSHKSDEVDCKEEHLAREIVLYMEQDMTALFLSEAEKKLKLQATVMDL